MSIPLVQNNEKDSINTSIIAIKRNIERINMLLGLVDSGSPDLSGLATKQELQDAVTELQPVDEVTVGNMQSVTSNAVAETLQDYATNSALINKNPFVVGNIYNSSSITYWKILNAKPTSGNCNVLYVLQSRSGELVILNIGDDDGTPVCKAKRLLNTYSKIAGLRYKDSTLYISLTNYSNITTITRLCGNYETRPTIQIATSAEYNSGTAITID